ncbi:MAG: cell division protein FtsB [Moritella sp.]|jgi:cell division protein FtsB
MKLINGLLQRLLFTLGFILFMQLPQFIDHYTQHLAGYYNAQQDQLRQYAAIAELNFNGQLNTLIAEFKLNASPEIQQVGKQVATLKASVKSLRQDVATLTDGDYLTQLYFLAKNINSSLAQSTLQRLKPGIPLSKAALITGVVGGLLINLIWLILSHTLLSIFNIYRTPATKPPESREC